MFVVGKERRAWWPVTWEAASDDGAETVENRLEMRFRVLDVDLLDALKARADRADLPEEGGELPRSTIYARLVMEFAVGWRGVGREIEGTDDVEPLSWAEENVALLMKQPGAWHATLKAFRECLAGRADIRAGN